MVLLKKESNTLCLETVPSKTYNATVLCHSQHTTLQTSPAEAKCHQRRQQKTLSVLFAPLSCPVSSCCTGHSTATDQKSHLEMLTHWSLYPIHQLHFFSVTLASSLHNWPQPCLISTSMIFKVQTQYLHKSR